MFGLLLDFMNSYYFIKVLFFEIRWKTNKFVEFKFCGQYKFNYLSNKMSSFIMKITD